MGNRWVSLTIKWAARLLVERCTFQLVIIKSVYCSRSGILKVRTDDTYVFWANCTEVWAEHIFLSMTEYTEPVYSRTLTACDQSAVFMYEEPDRSKHGNPQPPNSLSVLFFCSFFPSPPLCISLHSCERVEGRGNDSCVGLLGGLTTPVQQFMIDLTGTPGHPFSHHVQIPVQYDISKQGIIIIPFQCK